MGTTAFDPSEQVPLGTTGVAVTRLGLGTAPLGGLYRAVEESAALATVSESLRLGLRYFDTAPLYGSGLAEQRLGKALRVSPDVEVVVSTKVGRLLSPARSDSSRSRGNFFEGAPALEPYFDYSAGAITRSLEESLERLGLPSIDIVFVHDPDDDFEQARDEAIPVLHQLRDQGRIRAVGVGMNQSEMLAEFVRAGGVDCILVAGRYTLLDQSAADDLLPLCLDRGVAVIAGGVYNSGILADPSTGARYDYVEAPRELLAKAQALNHVCAGHGVPLQAAAIQFSEAHPAVTSVVIGCRTAEEISTSAAFARSPIPGQLWDDLRERGLLPPTAVVPGEKLAIKERIG